MEAAEGGLGGLCEANMWRLYGQDDGKRRLMSQGMLRGRLLTEVSEPGRCVWSVIDIGLGHGLMALTIRRQGFMMVCFQRRGSHGVEYQ